MSQDFQLIGTASDQLNRVANERQGWIDQTDVELPIEEFTDASDFSARDRRANRQALAFSHPAGQDPIVPTAAGFTQPPAAAVQVTPVAEQD